MREILFRGKRIDSEEWVEGGYFGVDEDGDALHAFILTNCQTRDFTSEHSVFTGHKVDKKTVGQFTGLSDKNGKKIFEGDIVKYNHSEYIRPLQVEWVTKYACYAFVDKGDFDQEHFLNETNCKDNIEIIGNIYDNPSLLK